MPDSTGLYDPLPEESSELATIKCAGCNETLNAAQFPPGMPCPTCRSPRRRMADGTILPKTSLLPLIIVIDIAVTTLLVLGLLYYFVWREPAVPPRVTEPHPGPTVEAPLPEAEPTPAPATRLQKSAAEQTDAAEPGLTFLDALPQPAILLHADVSIEDGDGDGIPTISGAGDADPAGEIRSVAEDAGSAGRDTLNAIPTITGDDLEPRDENYVPIEFVNPPTSTPMVAESAPTKAASNWSVRVVMSGNIHDAFNYRALDPERWAAAFHETPDPCQSYFMLDREQLLVGATEARPSGPKSLTWAGLIEGDFDAAVDFRWLLPPANGQCGLYLECVDKAGTVEAFLDIASWGNDADAKKIIFRGGGGAGAVSSAACPSVGRIRIVRRGDLLSAAVWDTHWIAIGESTCTSASFAIRFKGYSSSSCPRFALALDDFEVNHRRQATIALSPRTQQASAVMNLLDADPGNAPELADNGSRTGVVSIRETPLASGERGPGYSALPYAMAALPTGSVAADVQNQSDRDLMVGLRRDREGLDIRVPAGATKRAMIAAGTYTVVMRALDEPGALYETSPIELPSTTASLALTIAPAAIAQ